MFRSNPRLVLLLGALALPVFACGPFFPATLIDDRDALLAMPVIRFMDSLKKIASPPAKFRAVTGPASQSLSAQSLSAEVADLTAAGVAPAVIAAHRARRTALAERAL